MSPVTVADKETNPAPDTTSWPIDGTLDLHLFQPKEVGDLVPGYLDECRKRGGRWRMRQRLKLAVSTTGRAAFSLAPETMGGWGGRDGRGDEGKWVFL